jgi:hypothetical protein
MPTKRGSVTVTFKLKVVVDAIKDFKTVAQSSRTLARSSFTRKKIHVSRDSRYRMPSLVG